MTTINLSTTPLQSYQASITAGIIRSDGRQLAVVQQFDALYYALLTEARRRQAWPRLLYRPHLLRGIYLWGSVGAGKTFLMDGFFTSLPFQTKMRMHFHHFMAMVHARLRQHQGKKNPLIIIAKEISKQAWVLCLDELLVSDIADAMLLAGLFAALFKFGVCLVTTSNTPPEALYRNGLQREQFLPAIALLQQHTQVIPLETGMDYRLRHLKEAGVFFTPLDEYAANRMQQNFDHLTAGQMVETTPIVINGRAIPVIGRTQETIWFEFTDLCHIPRSQQDYLAIAKQFSTVMISRVPIIPSSDSDTICLFVSCIDVLYDARVRLVMSAAEPVAELYTRGFMQMDYARTHSRLLEMQSLDYFLS